MKIKTHHAHSRFRQRTTRMKIRRSSSLGTGAAAPQSRMYSLLLPPRYPADRR
jgi:hypothetical protein